jgi:hypothetical protein
MSNHLYNKFNLNHFFVDTFYFNSFKVLLFFSVLQLIFFSTLSNLFGISISLIIWVIARKFIFNRRTLYNFPFSTLLIIGFLISQFYIPVCFTLFEGKPVVYNLKFPYDVFFHNLLAFIILIITHQLYIFLRGSGRSPFFPLLQKKLAKLQLYSAISEKQIWIIGFIGLLSMFYLYFIVGISSSSETNTYYKFIQGLFPFTYAPYFVPMGKMFGSKSINKHIVFKLIFYSILLLGISLGANSRGALMLGFASLGFTYFLGILLNIFSVKIFSKKNILIGITAFIVITGPLTDFGLAMVIVRQQRVDITSLDLINKTILIYNDKESLNEYKKISKFLESESDWDENYFNNILLSRFSNLKFNDASLEQYYKINTVDADMTNYSINRVLATFPNPVLSAFNIDIDKEKILSNSFGDYLYFRASNEASALGGFRLGQFAGIGMASFGWFYLLILGILLIPIFYLFDLFYLKNVNSNQFRFSLCGLLIITSVFTFLSLSSISENVLNLVSYLLRGWIQIVFLYILIFYVSRFLTRLIPL